MTKPNEQLIAEVEQALVEIDEVDSLEIYPEKQVISWLRALLEENKDKYADIQNLKIQVHRLQEAFQQTCEEMGKVKHECSTYIMMSADLTGELEQVKAERDKALNEWDKSIDLWNSIVQSLRTELSAKDKVLEWYGDETNWDEQDRGIFVIPARVDSGKQARSILSQYEVSHD